VLEIEWVQAKGLGVATSTAFIMKVATRPTAQASKDGRRRLLLSLFDRESHDMCLDFTEFNRNANLFQLLDGKSRLFCPRKKIYGG